MDLTPETTRMLLWVGGFCQFLAALLLAPAALGRGRVSRSEAMIMTDFSEKKEGLLVFVVLSGFIIGLPLIFIEAFYLGSAYLQSNGFEAPEPTSLWVVHIALALSVLKYIIYFFAGRITNLISGGLSRVLQFLRSRRLLASAALTLLILGYSLELLANWPF